MGIKFNIEKGQRKALAQKIAEIIGADVVYLGVPSCAFQIDIFTLSMDAVLSFAYRSDTKIVEKVLDGLAEAGYTGESVPESVGTEGHKIIKAMRIYLGMSQREIADKVGINIAVYQRFEQIPGLIMRVNFSRVCKLLEIMGLNPNKFFMERYELNEAGCEVAERGTTGSPTNQQIRALQECCPVMYIRGVDKTTGEKILSTSLR